MLLTGITWVEVGKLGGGDDSEAMTAKLQSLDELLPVERIRWAQAKSMEGLADTFGLRKAPHWGSTPLTIQLDIQQHHPLESTEEVRLKLD